MNDPKSGALDWYRPDPRAHLPLANFHVSHSLKKRLKKTKPECFSVNLAFERVIRHCADREETWLDERLINAFIKLNYLGFAHSVEVWQDETQQELSGGLYGLALGKAFFAESMFSRQTDGSKMALYELVRRMKLNEFTLLETQFLTPHLKSLGAAEISASEYDTLLAEALSEISVRKNLNL